MSCVPEVVANDGTALQFCSPVLRGDRGVVLAATRQNGIALQFASPALRSDFGVVLAAVQQHTGALHLASPELQHHRQLRAAAELEREPVYDFYAQDDKWTQVQETELTWV